MNDATPIVVDADLASQIRKYDQNLTIQTEFPISPQPLVLLTPDSHCWEAPDNLYPSYKIPSTGKERFLLHNTMSYIISPLTTPFQLIWAVTSAVKRVVWCAYSISPRRPSDRAITFISSWLIKDFFHFSIFSPIYYLLLFLPDVPTFSYSFNTCRISYIPVKMERERGISFFFPKFYSRKLESIFCKSDRTDLRAYRYERAKRRFAIQSGSSEAQWRGWERLLW